MVKAFSTVPIIPIVVTKLPFRTQIFDQDKGIYSDLENLENFNFNLKMWSWNVTHVYKTESTRFILTQTRTAFDIVSHSLFQTEKQL